uniref:Prolyl 4-hydroxylase alpha subunit Fe(2+) 2OG dioxygenase domain-containing protein n=1 Tax=Ditylum brightwellii TaxID=49249 RepID=A0A7S4VU83_9STRA
MHFKHAILFVLLVAESSVVHGFTTSFPQSKLGHPTTTTVTCTHHAKVSNKEEEEDRPYRANLFQNDKLSRRNAIKSATIAATAGLNAELAWRNAVHTAAFALENTTPDTTNILPPGALQTIEAGKAVIIPNWLTPSETSAICQDVQQCFQDGHFTNFILSRNPNKVDKAANDRWIMPSFSKNRDGTNGPFVDPTIGNYELRHSLKLKMAQVKALLAKEMYDRPTLADDTQTHEMEYLRYGQGALLARHVDEHHLELKRPNGSKLPLKPNASRRSITWLIYLNDDWDGEVDGGQLRLHERQFDSVSYVGARKNDLQVGWLKAFQEKGEQPVFLDPNREGPENETCMLYTIDGSGNKRDLSTKPFANIALYLAGGDKVARSLMVSNGEDAKRLHLIDAPKSLVSSLKTKAGPAEGEDGGERIRDIVPKAGTLVMFDSVSLPHEVLMTNRERFGVQGWFHEKIYT